MVKYKYKERGELKMKGISINGYKKVYNIAKEQNKNFNEMLNEVCLFIEDGFEEEEVISWLND